MEKRIELEKRARKPSQITDLNLDNCRSTSIVGLTDEYTALESLSLINVGLTTLKGFPKLPNLKKLELSENRISNGLNYLTTSPKLQYLNLSGNKIKDLETLNPLQELKNLHSLDLVCNEVTQVENYREKIFAMIPSLKLLNFFDCNDVECATEDDECEEVNGNSSDGNSSDEVSDMGDEEEDEASFDYGPEDEEDDESEDEDNGDVSLAEVYNDDLEEDNSEWGAGSSDEEDDEDEDSDDEEAADGKKEENAAAKAVDSAASKTEQKSGAEEASEESEARGKKRKHDG